MNGVTANILAPVKIEGGSANSRDINSRCQAHAERSKDILTRLKNQRQSNPTEMAKVFISLSQEFFALDTETQQKNPQGFTAALTAYNELRVYVIQNEEQLFQSSPYVRHLRATEHSLRGAVAQNPGIKPWGSYFDDHYQRALRARDMASDDLESQIKISDGRMTPSDIGVKISETVGKGNSVTATLEGIRSDMSNFTYHIKLQIQNELDKIIQAMKDESQKQSLLELLEMIKKFETIQHRELSTPSQGQGQHSLPARPMAIPNVDMPIPLDQLNGGYQGMNGRGVDQIVERTNASDSSFSVEKEDMLE